MAKERGWEEGIEGYYRLQYWFFGYFCESLLVDVNEKLIERVTELLLESLLRYMRQIIWIGRSTLRLHLITRVCNRPLVHQVIS
jgi:hypothetical protein